MEFESGKVHKQYVSSDGRTVAIRWARPEDAEQLLSFINTMAAEDTFIPYGPNDLQDMESETKWLNDTLEACLNRDESYIVAEIDGRIVGAAEVKRELNGKSRTHHVAVFGISIIPEGRGLGLSHELIKMCLDHAKHLKGIRLLTLTAFSDNTTALSLYEKHGFREVGRVPNAYFRKNQYSDQVIMAQDIS